VDGAQPEYVGTAALTRPAEQSSADWTFSKTRRAALAPPGRGGQAYVSIDTKPQDLSLCLLHQQNFFHPIRLHELDLDNFVHRRGDRAAYEIRGNR
jgi:hypothetical protein